MRNIFILLLLACLTGCEKEKEWEGLPFTQVIHTQAIHSDFKSYYEKRVTVLGFIEEQEGDRNKFNLLPSRDYAELERISRGLATIILIPNNERIRKKLIGCYGKMAEIWGHVSIFSGMPSINRIETVRCADDGNSKDDVLVENT